MVVNALKRLQKALEAYDLIPLENTNMINSAGNYVLLDGVRRDKTATALVEFSLFVVLRALERDEGVYGTIDEIYKKVLVSAEYDNDFFVRDISLFRIEEGLFMYRIQITIKETIE